MVAGSKYVYNGQEIVSESGGVVLKKNYIATVFFFLSILFGSSLAAFAACSPGIPCTNYDIYSNPTAGTDPAFSGPKTGAASPYTNVSGATTSACDGNFMNQIYSRAFMEANREVIMSEQIIHKPDSVLEYTCFDQFINIAAHNAGSFSESRYWESMEIPLWTGGWDTTNNGVAPDHSTTTTINDTGADDGIENQDEYSVFGSERLDKVLEDFLFDVLQDYVDNNFGHTFLGEATTIDNDIDTSAIGANTYNCTHMSTIWEISKCLDFGEDDRFRSFEHLVNADPRSIPAECSPGNTSSDAVEEGSSSTKLDNTFSGGGADNAMPSGGVSEPCPPAGGVVSGVNTDFSNDLIRLANNCDDGSDLNAYSSFDVIETYTDMIKGFGSYIAGVGSSSGTITCSDPIPTGLAVITYKITTSSSADGVDVANRSYSLHYDHICPNPGCYYQPVKTSYTWGDPIPAVDRDMTISGASISKAVIDGSCVPF